MILVIGGSGLLGRALLQDLGDQAVGTSMTRRVPGLIPVDSRDLSALLNLASSVRPDIVVNLVAERRPTRWGDREQLHEANVTTAVNAARVAREVHATLIHISTDYVFPSGGPFAPDHPHAPMNPYGQTKSAAESEVRRLLPGTVIVRMPVLYGPVQSPGECNLSELVTRIAAAQAPIALDSWARRRPTHVADVARSVRSIAESAGSWEGKSVHVSAKQWYSQYEMGVCVTELIGISPERIRAADRPVDDRPRRVELALHQDTPFLSEYRCLEDGLALLVDSYLATGKAS